MGIAQAAGLRYMYVQFAFGRSQHSPACVLLALSLPCDAWQAAERSIRSQKCRTAVATAIPSNVMVVV
eukprot:COSAG02_NODE_50338_length_321_cov_0.698198_1_plen_67_part_01